MMINSSGCTAGGCVDAQSPVQPGTSKLHQWAEADREFLRRLCNHNEDVDSSRSPIVLHSVSDVDNYNVNVGRQKYLQSYRFTRKEEESNIAVTVSDRIVEKWRRLMIKSHLKKMVNVSSSDTDHQYRPCYVFGLLFTCFTPKSSLLKRLT